MRGEAAGAEGVIVKARRFAVPIGEGCAIEASGRRVLGEVVGFRAEEAMIAPIGFLEGIKRGCEVVSLGGPLTIPVGRGLLSRVIDAFGNPLDGRGPVVAEERRPLTASAPKPLERRPIRDPLPTGVRAIDGFLTLGKGQRMGIFAGSGVGKSTLLGMIARGTRADVVVVALVGERGREVGEFIEDKLGEEGLRKAVVVVATSDRPPLERVKAAMAATAIAEYFRDLGLDVLLLLDSLTRLAWAQRELGLSMGEPPATKGFTPSVFALFPPLLERAGTGSSGSITAIYTVLIEGDDLLDPIADVVRGILDGHIVLSRELAGRGHYPPVDVLQSVSRVMDRVVSEGHARAALKGRRLIAKLREIEDLVLMGAYSRGSDPEADEALERAKEIEGFLRQSKEEVEPFERTVEKLAEVVGMP